MKGIEFFEIFYFLDFICLKFGSSFLLIYINRKEDAENLKSRQNLKKPLRAAKNEKIYSFIFGGYLFDPAVLWAGAK